MKVIRLKRDKKVNNMEKLDFSIQDANTLTKKDSYVTLQAGKGKDHKSIHFNAIGFSYIEGLIWDKHREYGNSSKTKISSPDWTRILEGFEISSKELSEFKSGDDIKEILKFEIFSPPHPLDNILEQTTELKKLLNDLSAWLYNVANKEKYILILKNNV